MPTHPYSNPIKKYSTLRVSKKPRYKRPPAPSHRLTLFVVVVVVDIPRDDLRVEDPLFLAALRGRVDLYIYIAHNYIYITTTCLDNVHLYI